MAVVNSTGLRVHDGSEWMQEKHGLPRCPVRYEVSSETGAYDDVPTIATIRHAFGPDVELIIPPPRSAVFGDCQTRNVHIDMTTETGRMAWQRATGYGQRSRNATEIGRYKQVIGPELSSRNIEIQTIEARIAVNALNSMTRLGRAAYERVSFRTKITSKCGPSAIRATRSIVGQQGCVQEDQMRYTFGKSAHNFQRKACVRHIEDAIRDFFKRLALRNVSDLWPCKTGEGFHLIAPKIGVIQKARCQDEMREGHDDSLDIAARMARARLRTGSSTI